MTTTWRAVRDEATAQLAAAGVPAPAAEATWLVERANGYEGDEREMGLDLAPTVRTLAAFDAMVARRIDGEPLQYVLGSWAFRHLDLHVDRRVLIPRPETEVVAGVAIDELRRAAAGRPDRRVVAVDLGTGSGAIGLSLAVEVPEAEVWLTDRSPVALEVATANLAGVGRAGARVRVVEGSWYEPLPAELAGHVDVVVSNPPYVADHEELPAEVSEWEPRSALFAGPTGLEAVGAVVADAPRWLGDGGSLVVEIAPHQAEAAVALARPGFESVEVLDDLAGRPRVLRARL